MYVFYGEVTAHATMLLIWLFTVIFIHKRHSYNHTLYINMFYVTENCNVHVALLSIQWRVNTKLVILVYSKCLLFATCFQQLLKITKPISTHLAANNAETNKPAPSGGSAISIFNICESLANSCLSN